MSAISTDRELSAIMKHYKAVFGLCGSDHFSCSVPKGLKSLSARMALNCINALEIAKFLEAVSGVIKALCPALPSFSCYCLRRRDYYLTDTVLSFVLDCSDAAKRSPLAKRFLDNLEAFGLADLGEGYKIQAAPAL